jgi:hypothetical protein
MQERIHREADASFFSLWLSSTFNNLQVSDGCVSPSKHVHDELIVGCNVGREIRWPALAQ